MAFWGERKHKTFVFLTVDTNLENGKMQRDVAWLKNFNPRLKRGLQSTI
jgi:hypothetical protein